MSRYRRCFDRYLLAGFIGAVACVTSVHSQSSVRPRTIVTTDPELDDSNSLVSINLCPCTSWRWKPGERYIHDAVEIYAQVYANLRVHDPNYPTPEFLRSKIREGNVEFEGDISKENPPI